MRTEEGFVHRDLCRARHIRAEDGSVTVSGFSLESRWEGEDAPVNPASFRVETARMTCSMHGLKQHIRVVRPFYRPNVHVRRATCDV